CLHSRRSAPAPPREGPRMAPADPPDGGPLFDPLAPPGPGDALIVAPLPERTADPHRGFALRRSPSSRIAEVSVVIVNFCQWRNTARLARQLRRSLAV